jgi:hypothetical protein
VSLGLGGIVVIAALMLSGGSAFAETSANTIMPGCRAFLTQSNRELWGSPFCAGVIVGLRAVPDISCEPDSVTTGQVVRVLVQYIDARPARMHEDFRKLALEAMKAAWPCQR